MFRTNRNPGESKPDAETKVEPAPPSAPVYQGSMHNQTEPVTRTTTPAISDSESLARDIKEGTISGFVGNGTTLTGDIAFNGMLRVDGRLSGSVNSPDGTLIVSTNGLVEADIEVAAAQIHGTVRGDIIASKRIEMGRVAKVTGDIYTPALAIAEGAVFEGACRMTEKPSARQAAKKKMKELNLPTKAQA